MRKLLRWSLAGSSILALSSASYWIAERHVAARFDDLTSGLQRPENQVHRDHFWMTRARLTALDGYLDQRAPARAGLGAPSMWGTERRADLERGLASLGSFFEQVDTLLEDRDSKLALQMGAPASTEPPVLQFSRHRTNVLCSRALLDFEGPDGSRAAARWLGKAFDLLRLGDDGSTYGYMIASGEEDTVLNALHLVLEDPRAEGVVFRSELDPRLARISADQRVALALGDDVGAYLRYERTNGAESWSAPWKAVDRLFSKIRVADGLAMSVRLLRSSGAESDALYDMERTTDFGPWAQSWVTVAHLSHLELARRDIARRALAVSAGLATLEAPPADRFTGDPLREESTDRGVEVRAEGTLAALGASPTDPAGRLLCWTIPR